MIGIQLDPEQQRALDLPLEAAVFVGGDCGTGKSRILNARIARARTEHPDARLLIAPTREALVRAAFDVLATQPRPIVPIDEPAARDLFAAAARPLLELDFARLGSEGSLDPEVAGLRHPQRFLDAAYHLVAKLCDAAITPDAFLAAALKGAAAFSTQLPNLADPVLLSETKAAYRDSLAADGPEIARQYGREVDLAKILAALYAQFLAELDRRAVAYDADALPRAAAALEARRAVDQAPYGFGFVDDVERLGASALRFLRAAFGPALGRVTLAGRSWDGGDDTTAVTLQRNHRSAAAIAHAAACIERRSGPHVESAGAAGLVRLHRCADEGDEAAFVADEVASHIAAGAEPEQIAVIFRSVAAVAGYETALLERDVPVAIFGDFHPFRDRRSLDALALLWNVYDPFRHDWMVRTLEGPLLALSDATIATLCSEPDRAAVPLFTLEDEPAPTVRAARWDPRRDLRLGWNVVRGDRDAALSDEARRRVAAFRRNRRAWLNAIDAVGFEDFARAVWQQLPRDGAPGSARARAQQWILHLLLRRLLDFHRADPGAGLGGVLREAERHAASDLVRTDVEPLTGFVRLISVEAAAGLEFDHVVIPRARPGNFPRWYAPDAFLFSPRHGMIPKENAGGTQAARTAKFTHYMHRARARDGYNARERAAFAYAMRRARASLTISAAGVPTGGRSAPEFLEELRTARPPGSIIV